MNADPNPLPKFTEPVDPDPIRPHVFDEDICEYDKRLPNWWLFTFWGAVAFAFAYWIFAHELHLMPDDGLALKEEMAANTELASRRSGVIDDDLLWKLSKDPSIVQAGATTFTTTCASCHLADLTGSIGPNLKDVQWIHGGQPLEIMRTINDGVLAKGMPTWGPILGKQKITELTAFILSFHHTGEKIEIVPGWTPIVPGTGATAQISAPAAQ